MKQYLAVTFDPETDETKAAFFEKYGQAYDYLTDCECGLGIVCHIYELNKQGFYELIFC